MNADSQFRYAPDTNVLLQTTDTHLSYITFICI
jgi:hypothetical protein